LRGAVPLDADFAMREVCVAQLLGAGRLFREQVSIDGGNSRKVSEYQNHALKIIKIKIRKVLHSIFRRGRMRPVQGLEDSARFSLREAGPRFSMGVLLTAHQQFVDETWISPISRGLCVFTPSPFQAVLREICSFGPIAHCDFHAEEATCPIGIPLR
jgi:hypothetical protein